MTAQNERTHAERTHAGNKRYVDALARLRSDWEEAAEGQPLVNVRGSVGLLMADLADFLDLSPEERAEALGHGLNFDTSGWSIIEAD